MNNLAGIVILILIMVAIFIAFNCKLSCGGTETYTSNDPDRNSDFIDYNQMSHLPWCTPPITNLGAPSPRRGIPAGCGNSPLSVCQYLKRKYPGNIFGTGIVPLSCAPDKYSIYETGNVQSPSIKHVGLP